MKKIIEYLIGNFRQRATDLKCDWIIRKHIREQYRWRIIVMNKECLLNGECIHCGCETPALQYAQKECEAKCYPKMMGKKEWNKFKMI